MTITDKTWDLSILYGSFEDARFREDMAEAMALAKAARDRVAVPYDETAPQWPEAVLGDIEACDRALAKAAEVSSFVSLTHMADVTNRAANDLMPAIADIKRENALATDALGTKVASIKNMRPVYAEPRLALYGDYFRHMKALASHTPAPKVNEAIRTLQLSGGYGWQRLRGELLARTEARLTVDGETLAMPLSAAANLYTDGRAATRRAAYEAELCAMAAVAPALAACLGNIKREAAAVARLRGYDSVLRWMLDVNRMSERTFSAMMGAMERGLGIFRKYLLAKAKLLGHEGGMPFYDLYAPVGDAPEHAYSPGETGELLSSIFSEVAPEMGAFIAHAFEERWIDFEPRLNKQGGALCAPLPTKGESRVFANCGGNMQGVLTLAHELGHGFHDRCTCHIPMLMLDAPTPVCETASTFNETVVYEALLAGATPGEKLRIIDELLSGATKNIVDIYSRFLFEDEVIKRQGKAALPADELCRIMKRAQMAAYGDALDPAFLHPYMWAAKVHYTIVDYHYYNFPYAFGLLFSQGIYAMYREDRENFYGRYKALLGGTCTGTLEEIAMNAGIDIGTERFWDGAVASLGEKVEMFIQLAEKR